MRRTFLNVVLLGAAFAFATLASTAGVVARPAGEASATLITASTVLCAAFGAWTWTKASLQIGESGWTPAAELLGAPFQHWRTGISGSLSGTPVRIRIETAKSNALYLDISAAAASKAKYFLVLTVTLPFRDLHSWSLQFRADPAEVTGGQWRVVCPTDPGLSGTLEAFGLNEVLREWSRDTVLKCNARMGELTLRYPVAHLNDCPTPAEIKGEIQVLRRVTALWQCAIHTELAA